MHKSRTILAWKAVKLYNVDVQLKLNSITQLYTKKVVSKYLEEIR